MDQTTPYTTKIMPKVFAPPVLLAVIVGLGTGGDVSDAYQRQMHDLGMGWYTYVPTAQSAAEYAEHNTASINIERIRSILKLTTSDLARHLGVSRQAIYLWKSGGPIKRDNIAKLMNLDGAADVLAPISRELSPFQLERKLPDGRTLLESIGAGHDGASAAKQLLAILTKEAAQRSSLSQILAGNAVSESEGFLAPHLQEDG